tara:strand:+ start:47 stop:751 length:705 start_codon:yes stop_codon:yes gene_type:complete
MEQIAQIRKLSLWIFLVPLISVNLCLVISVNAELLEGTLFTVDRIGQSGFTIPYIDGSLSISRASRTYPQFMIFKPMMILTSVLLVYYWIKNNKLINYFNNSGNQSFKFRTFGILSAICLAIHSVLLGVEFDIKIFKLLRRVVLLSFIIFEIVAQGILVYHFYKLKEKMIGSFNPLILNLKILLVSLLILVAIVSLPILIESGKVHFKHALEWNYFVGVILFYLLTRLFWKRTT